MSTHDLTEITERAEKAEKELARRKEWIDSAMRDYTRMKEWLNARGKTEWEDTVTEVLSRCEAAEQARQKAEADTFAAMQAADKKTERIEELVKLCEAAEQRADKMREELAESRAMHKEAVNIGIRANADVAALREQLAKATEERDELLHRVDATESTRDFNAYKRKEAEQRAAESDAVLEQAQAVLRRTVCPQCHTGADPVFCRDECHALITAAFSSSPSAALEQVRREERERILNHVAVILNWCDLALKAQGKSLMTAEENGARIILNHMIDANGLRRKQCPKCGDLMDDENCARCGFAIRALGGEPATPPTAEQVCEDIQKAERMTAEDAMTRVGEPATEQASEQPKTKMTREQMVLQFLESQAGQEFSSVAIYQELANAGTVRHIDDVRAALSHLLDERKIEFTKDRKYRLKTAAVSPPAPDPDRGRVVLQIGHERGLQFRFPDACESWEEWSQLAIEHANAIVDAVLAAEQERQKGK